MLSASRMMFHFGMKFGGNIGMGELIEPERSRTISRSGGSPRFSTAMSWLCEPHEEVSRCAPASMVSVG